MIKKIISITFLLGTFHCSFSQFNKKDPSEKWYVRLNFPGLLDGLDQNFSTGLEYRFAPRWSTGSDIAWIFYSKYFTETQSANGIIIRPFIRYYVHQQRRQRSFIEAELHYKFASYEIQDWLGREPVNGVPSYEEFTTFHYNKNVFGIHLKAGNQTYLTRDDKLRMEFNYGVGVRWKWQGVKNGVYNRTSSFGELFDSRVSTGVLLFSFRLVYAIK